MQPDSIKTYEYVPTLPASPFQNVPPVEKAPYKILRWWFRKDSYIYFWAFFSLLVATLVLFFFSNPPKLSPLIVSYLDLLDVRAAWAIPEIVGKHQNSFWLSFAFVIVLSIFLCYTYLLCRESGLADAPEERLKDDAEKELVENEGGLAVTEPRREVASPLGTRYFGFSRGLPAFGDYWWVYVLFIVMALSNAFLFYYFDKQLKNPLVPQTSGDFMWTYFIAIVSRLVGVFIGLGALFQLFLEDFGRSIADFWRAYWKYFYPPLLAIAVVAFVFTRMDQFDGLFIELVNSWWNFILFCGLLFPASIIIIWFTPAYLIFTDKQFANRQDSWDILNNLVDVPKKNESSFRNTVIWILSTLFTFLNPLWRLIARIFGQRPAVRRPGLYYWMVLHKRLFPQLDKVTSKPIPDDFMPYTAQEVVSPSKNFHRFRAFLGMTYILTLISLCADIYFGNQAVENRSAGWLVLITFLGVLFYVIFALGISHWARLDKKTTEREYPKETKPEGIWWFNALRERAREKRGANGEVKIKTVETEIVIVKKSWPFWVGVGFLAVALFAFIVTCFKVGGGSEAWEDRFGWFLIFLVSSIFSFAWLASYQPFYSLKYTFSAKNEKRCPTDRLMDRIDHVTIQAMLYINPLIAFLAVAYFLEGLFGENWAASGFVADLNPLNVYLLLINGLIASIILFDRYLLLRDRKKQYLEVVGDKKSTKQSIASANVFWGLAIIGVLLASNYLGNSYHEIQYHEPDKATAGAPSLLQYTTNFIADTAKAGPVIFIAADGGGLKACYWTMLNLLYLDEQGLYDGHVFALSGASGGTIGLSMYNYLKAQNFPTDSIRQYITRIGEGNYLSGDFTGLLTRFPLNYLPNLPGLEPHQFNDRMESMAMSYFRIVGENGKGYGYEQIREAPFWKPWKDKLSLPLLIINTARAEDGLLGTVMPLDTNPLLGSVDLTYDKDGKAISYPDATFLSNRFPLASPAGRITGKGHFLDAGSADNSGINSLYSLLRTLKARSLDASEVNNPYRQIFDRKVVVISLRNAASRYVRDEFLADLDSLNRYPYKSELSANTGVALNTGLTGVPISWDDYLRGPVPRQIDLIHGYFSINLPFRLRNGDVYTSLGGELRLPDLKWKRDSLNQLINTHLGREADFAVMPPLGRLLAAPVRQYMDRMISFPKIKETYEQVRLVKADKKPPKLPGSGSE